MLVDSHCHLNDKRYTDIAAVVERATQAGISHMQTICTTKDEFEEVHTLTTKFQNVFCSVGIHPHEAEKEGADSTWLHAMSQRPKVIGIGETGLDYYYNNAPATAQKRNFEMHLEAARAADMPVIIHTRDAEDDTMHMLDNALKQGPLKLLFHCFTSSARLAAYAVERGIYVSASGIITFKKSEDLRKAFALVPMELLLVETDAPYLAPEPHRGAVNEPAHTKWVAQKLAEVKGVPLETLAEATTQNFFKLFPKANKA